MKTLERFIYITALILLGLLWSCPDNQDDLSPRLHELLQENKELHSTVERTEIRARSVERALSSLSNEHTQVLDLVRTLQANPKVITQVRTIQVGSEYETPELPQEHKFTLDSGLVVGRFINEENYRFITYDLHTKATVMVGRDQGAALIQIKSSYDNNQYYDIPVDSFEMYDTTEEHKPWRPQVSIGIRAGLHKEPALTGQLLITAYNQRCFSALGATVAANTNTVHFGIVPVTYNIGCHIKHVDNIQIVPDAFVDIQGQFGLGLGIATRF